MRTFTDSILVSSSKTYNRIYALNVVNAMSKLTFGNNLKVLFNKTSIQCRQLKAERDKVAVKVVDNENLKNSD